MSTTTRWSLGIGAIFGIVGTLVGYFFVPLVTAAGMPSVVFGMIVAGTTTLTGAWLGGIYGLRREFR